MIYFIQAGTRGPIKIGYAADPHRRIKSLQTANSEKLTLLKAIEGDIDFEKRIHKALKKYRLNGEWFSFEAVAAISEFGESSIETEEHGGKLYPVLTRNAENLPAGPCPFCFSHHHHGTGDGHRVSHCVFGVPEIVVKGQRLRRDDGYIIRTAINSLDA